MPARAPEQIGAGADEGEAAPAADDPDAIPPKRGDPDRDCGDPMAAPGLDLGRNVAQADAAP